MTACGTTHGALRSNGVVLSHVPFVSQDDFHCGPSALAMVIQYWDTKLKTGRNVSVDRIIQDIYSPTARGVLGIDLERYAQQLGFVTHQYSGNIDDIKQRINDGIPLILLVDYGMSVYQQNHFIVTTGYTERGIIVNSGRTHHDIIPEERLKKIWEKTGFWTLLIKPSSL